MLVHIKSLTHNLVQALMLFGYDNKSRGNPLRLSDWPRWYFDSAYQPTCANSVENLYNQSCALFYARALQMCTLMVYWPPFYWQIFSHFCSIHFASGLGCCLTEIHFCFLKRAGQVLPMSKEDKTQIYANVQCSLPSMTISIWQFLELSNINT